MLHVAVRVPFGEARAIEWKAHQLLQRSHVKNEWFDLVPSRAIVTTVLQAAKVDMPSPKPVCPSYSVRPGNYSRHTHSLPFDETTSCGIWIRLNYENRPFSIA